METIIFLDHLKQNVLKNYGKAYTLDMTFTRGSPEAATLLASGQADLATLASGAFATTIDKNAVSGGMTIIADNYQDGHPGHATNTFFVLKDSPIKTITDLKGKKIAINAFGSAVDLVLRVVLKKDGIDPRRDVQIVEVAFPNIGAGHSREARRLRRAGHSVPAGRSSQGRPARAVHRRRRVGPGLGHLPGRDQRISERAMRRPCAASSPTMSQGLAWYYDPANRDQGDRDHRRLHQVAEGRAGFRTSPPRATTIRDPNGCVSAGGDPEADRRHGREKLIDRRIDVAKYINLSLPAEAVRDLTHRQDRDPRSPRPTRRTTARCPHSGRRLSPSSEGEFVSIVGPSGCGKSTLLYMVGGFLDADGEVLVDGTPHHRPGHRPRRRVPGIRAVSLAHRAREHRVRAGARRHAAGRARGDHRTG